MVILLIDVQKKLFIKKIHLQNYCINVKIQIESLENCLRATYEFIYIIY